MYKDRVNEIFTDRVDKKLDGSGLKIFCIPGNDDMDEMDVIVFTKLTELIPGDLEMLI